MFEYFLSGENLKDKKFGKLKILDLDYENKEIGCRKYNCICDCGNTIIVDEADLFSGRITDCGCKNKEEYIILSCKNCNSTIKVPFNKKNLIKTEETYKDEEGRIHIQVCYQLDYVCNKCYLMLENINLLNNKLDKIELFKKFINETCIIDEHIPVNDRIRRSKFRELYIKWLKENKLKNYNLTSKQLNYILKDLYEETYIKSDGIFYMKKIKFKEF